MLWRILLIAALLSVPGLAQATIWHVPGQVATIQGAADIAADGDTVLVAPGTYFENLFLYDRSITLASHFLTTQDTTYISSTIIDGGQGNGYYPSVLRFLCCDGITVSGFSLVNGLGSSDSGGIGSWGGGILAEACLNGTFRHLIIRENATQYGDGSGAVGGGLYALASGFTMENLVVVDNLSVFDGGGIGIFGGNVTMFNCLIANNQADWGGGVFNGSSNLLMESCAVTNNQGGGVFGTGTISCNRCVISGNVTQGYGAGILFSGGHGPLILVNTTLGDNTAEGTDPLRSGGLWLFDGASALLVNTVFWNNQPVEIAYWAQAGPCTTTVAYSLVAGGEAGIQTHGNGTVEWLAGNLDEDPFFLGGAGGYHLSPDSPCIDAGTAYFEWQGQVIVDLSPGDYHGLAPDMGAYEYDPDVAGVGSSAPVSGLVLYPNVPDPFNPVTTIGFNLASAGRVDLTIYDLAGRVVVRLLDEERAAGPGQMVWDGRDRTGAAVASGVYVARLRSADGTRTEKLVLAR